MAEEFERWVPLRDLALSHLARHGDSPAVYYMRYTTGEVLKYGCTRCLRTRIVGNYLGGIGGSTTQRIHHALFEKGMIDRVEIAWIETNSEAEARLKESEYRRAYKKIHGRRPAWDLMD